MENDKDEWFKEMEWLRILYPETFIRLCESRDAAKKAWLDSKD